MSDTAKGSKPSFGFGALDDIEPREAKVTPGERPAARGRSSAEPQPAPAKQSAVLSKGATSTRAADDAAAKLGFASREPLLRRRKRQPIEEPVEQINLRAAVADINVFVEWCENNRYSYREGFAELVKHIDSKVA